MTVLVFRKDNNKATELVSPDKARISLQTKSDNVRWRHNEVNFDLVTMLPIRTQGCLAPPPLYPFFDVSVCAGTLGRTSRGCGPCSWTPGPRPPSRPCS